MASLEVIVGAVSETTAEGIAESIEVLVARGTLSGGSRLPTVRRLARELSVSPTTVAAAWRQLVSSGVIETRGRAGSFVVEPAAPRRRSWLSGSPGRYRLDLSTGSPDPTLLPDISGAIQRAAAQTAESYMEPVVLPALERAIREDLPFEPGALTVVDGAIDAMDRTFAQVVRRGAAVIVENPCFPPIAELVIEYGGRLRPVPVDADGIDLEALEDAGAGASVLVFQPRANNPTGVSTSPERLDHISDFLGRHPDVFVIEDDSSGEIASHPAATLAARHPDRVVHIKSYSKSHGPDLRMAALAGPSAVVDAVVVRRLLGPVWTSRILQRTLLGLLTDDTVVEGVRAAAREYDRRRTNLATGLAERGVAVGGRHGINVWVPVDDERDAMVVLASHGVGVAPGSPFQLLPSEAPHIRVTLATEPPSWARLCDQIAEASTTRSGPRRSLV